jgi:hypothetical protein
MYKGGMPRYSYTDDANTPETSHLKSK